MTAKTRHELISEMLDWHIPDSAHESGCALRCGYYGADLGQHLASELENAGLLESVSGLRKAILIWAERFIPGDRWDTEDLHDLESALKGTVESHPTAHWRREMERLRAEYLAFTSRLGFGDDVTEPAATLAQLIDPIEEAFSKAGDHFECAIVCELCGESLASQVCEHCNGSGCKANPQFAYSECEWCAGAGRVHPGCVEVSYADLVAQRDAAYAKGESAAIGPVFPMYGFGGCTSQDSDFCACATDEDVECAVCGEVIDPGTPTFARSQGQPWMDGEDSEQDWVTLWWHSDCDTRTLEGEVTS